MNKKQDLRIYIFDNLLILTFVASLFLPLFLINKRDVSDIEKRKLATFPELKWERKAITEFPAKFETFFSDRFGFRDQLVQIHSLFGLVLKSSSNPKILLGEDNWLFYVNPNHGNSLEDYRKNDPFTPNELNIWKTSLEAKYRFLKQKNIPYIFVIAPDKHSIYGEYIPSRINQVGKQTRFEQLLAYMRDSEVPIIDLRPSLLKVKTEGLSYYKNDAHWNNFGAAIAQYEIIKYIQKYYPNLAPIDYPAQYFYWAEIKGGDITDMLNISAQMKDTSPRLWKPFLSCNNKTIEEQKEDTSRSTFSTECNKNAPKALIFADSFFIALQPYISQYFSKALYVWMQPDFNQLKQYVESYHPDIVIEERVERDLKYIPTIPISQNPPKN